MELTKYFRSVLEQDSCAVVLCSLDHQIIYMNPAAVSRYARSGGASLVGKSLLDCHSAPARDRIERVTAWFAESQANNRIYTFRNEEENKDVYMVALRDTDGTLIGYYEKHEYRMPETAALYDFGLPQDASAERTVKE